MVDRMDGVPLGGVLVGGRSSRFGSDKALARVGDRSMAERAVRALRVACDPVVLVGGDGTLAERMALPWRADELPGCGPLGGVASGLRWARELGCSGLLVLACDLPLVSSSLVKALATAAARTGADALVPAVGTAAPQPLCAWYAVGVLPRVEERLERGQHAMHGLLERIRVERLPWGSEGGEVELLNVNRPEDLAHARRHVAGEPGR